MPVALAGTLAAIALRVLAVVSAGPLWRDEAGSASTATVPTFAEFWSRQHMDSFPLLWQLLLRGWTLFVWNGDDTAIRTLGLVVSLLVLPALWWTSRALRVVPLASLLFAGVTPLFVVWAGIQNRAYGLGVVLLAVLIGAVWRMVERPSLGRSALTAVVALLAVHTTYQLPVMLAALLGAAALVGLRRRDLRLVITAAVIGVASAASLLIYTGVLARARGLAKMVYGRVTPESIVRGLQNALEPGGWVALVVLALVVLACAWGLWRGLRARAVDRDRDRDDDAPAALLFASSAALLAVVGQVLFLFQLSFLVQPWYYATAILVVTTAFDVVLQRGIAQRGLRDGIAGVVALLLVVTTVAAVGSVTQRQSNLDLVATYLRQYARPGDLIVVYPWHYGVSFDRYYDGAVPFMTVPDVAGHDFHRFDQLEELMRDPELIKPGYRRIYQTLQAGGGVWLVGHPADETPEQFPVPRAARDDDPSSWRDGFYTALSGLQLRWVLAQSSPTATTIPPLTEQRVRDYEDAPVTLYSVQPR